VLRYQDISGVSPAYQQQTILEKGVTNISGTHLGAWLDLPNGNRSWGEGIKFGLFTYTLSAGPAAGYADFDYFRYSHDGP
jgi:hypothetical protein